MTNLEKLDAYAECARRDGDEDAAKAIEDMRAELERTQYERDSLLDKYASTAAENACGLASYIDEKAARERAERERDAAIASAEQAEKERLTVWWAADLARDHLRSAGDATTLVAALDDALRGEAPPLVTQLRTERVRAEQAEKERDEAREALKRSSGERHEEWRAKVDAVAARERAEARTNELLHDVQQLRSRLSEGEDEVANLKADLLHERKEWRATCDAIERERDEARTEQERLHKNTREAQEHASRAVEERIQAESSRERAEADNAALLTEMTNIALLLSGEPKVESALRIAALVTRTLRVHPGAAMLEYVRALEAVKDAAERAHVCGKDECRQCYYLSDALAKADALKERK